jgi:PPK2 family polyphosphate:nucleotide phosphotransferase
MSGLVSGHDEADKFHMPFKVLERYRVEPGVRFELSSIDPGEKTLWEHLNKDDHEGAMDELRDGLQHLQKVLFAENKHRVLIILQAMDTGGKDGCIKHVFSRIDPQGLSVASFKKPTEEELAHDFLWRTHLAAPRRGFIGVFNRSHYEDVLIGRVRKFAPKDEIEARYDQINAFEKILSENGTTILKFMLHISKKEQGERLQERLDEAKSRWKFNPSDLDDRKLWDDYQAAYEIMLDRCSTAWAPWFVIPADRKWARNAAIAAIVRATLEQMDPRYPKPPWDPKSFKVD